MTQFKRKKSTRLPGETPIWVLQISLVACLVLWLVVMWAPFSGHDEALERSHAQKLLLQHQQQEQHAGMSMLRAQSDLVAMQQKLNEENQQQQHGNVVFLGKNEEPNGQEQQQQQADDDAEGDDSVEGDEENGNDDTNDDEEEEEEGGGGDDDDDEEKEDDEDEDGDENEEGEEAGDGDDEDAADADDDDDDDDGDDDDDDDDDDDNDKEDEGGDDDDDDDDDDNDNDEDEDGGDEEEVAEEQRRLRSKGGDNSNEDSNNQNNTDNESNNNDGSSHTGTENDGLDQLDSKQFIIELAGLTTGGGNDEEAESTAQIKIQTRPAWAHIGAAHFHQLVENGFYNQCRFFRVVPKFVVQFGINGDPPTQATWANDVLPDDPVVQTNKRGTVTFATAGPNTRTTQLFINLVDNGRLDNQGFAPFAQVVEGMEHVDRINSEYHEKPNQGRIESEGNAYLNEHFPNLSYIVTVYEDENQGSITPP